MVEASKKIDFSCLYDEGVKTAKKIFKMHKGITSFEEYLKIGQKIDLGVYMDTHDDENEGILTFEKFLRSMYQEPPPVQNEENTDEYAFLYDSSEEEIRFVAKEISMDENFLDLQENMEFAKFDDDEKKEKDTSEDCEKSDEQQNKEVIVEHDFDFLNPTFDERNDIIPVIGGQQPNLPMEIVNQKKKKKENKKRVCKEKEKEKRKKKEKERRKKKEKEKEKEKRKGKQKGKGKKRKRSVEDDERDVGGVRKRSAPEGFINYDKVGSNYRVQCKLCNLVVDKRTAVNKRHSHDDDVVKSH